MLILPRYFVEHYSRFNVNQWRSYSQSISIILGHQNSLGFLWSNLSCSLRFQMFTPNSPYLYYRVFPCGFQYTLRLFRCIAADLTSFLAYALLPFTSHAYITFPLIFFATGGGSFTHPRTCSFQIISYLIHIVLTLWSPMTEFFINWVVR